MSNVEMQIGPLELTDKDTKLPSWVCNFINIYQQLSTDNLDLLEQIYDQHIIFEDPIHKVEGYRNLREYFKLLYTNLDSCTFSITDVIANDDSAAIYWTMSFVHAKLNSRNAIEVQGTSKIIRKGDKVINHRDFLDVGAMLYEQIPVIGRMIKMIKKRAIK